MKIKFFQVLKQVSLILIVVCLFHVVADVINWYQYDYQFNWTWTVLYIANVVAYVLVDNHLDDLIFGELMKTLEEIHDLFIDHSNK